MLKRESNEEPTGNTEWHAPIGAGVGLLLWVLFGCISTLFASPLGTPSTGPSPVFKPHQGIWEANRHRIVPYRPAKYHNFPLAPQIVDPGYVVYGYLPYWEIDYDGFRWDQLTHVAYFAASVDGSGNITDSKQWFDPSVTNLIAEAHANGVRVVLTVTNFDNAQIGQLVGSSEIRAKVVAKLLEMVQAQGADGVSIDFEFVPKEAKGNFVTFMSELTKAFHQAIPNSHVSYAGPSVDWSNAYDYGALASACDHVFIMAYGYHWGGSDPGPTSPLTSGNVWSKYNVTWTVDDYLTKGGNAIKSHVIVGLPLYGRDWKSTNDQIPGKKLANGVAVTYDEALVAGPKVGWKWDTASQCPYYMYQEAGTWHQTWVDSATSLGLKFDLAKQKQVAGIGFWALGYDGTDDQIWAEVAQRYPPKVQQIVDDPDAGITDEPDIAGMADGGASDAVHAGDDGGVRGDGSDKGDATTDQDSESDVVWGDVMGGTSDTQHEPFLDDYHSFYIPSPPTRRGGAGLVDQADDANSLPYDVSPQSAVSPGDGGCTTQQPTTGAFGGLLCVVVFALWFAHLRRQGRLSYQSGKPIR